MHLLLSRPDRIGDVTLTLPLAGALKTLLPGPVRITFLGASYTRAVVESCEFVDDFLAWNEIQENPVRALRELRADVMLHVLPRRDIAVAALRAGIPRRIGTRNRWFHWFTCTRLLALSRKNSDLHEAQLNLKFLEAFGIHRPFSFPEIHALQGLRPRQELAPEHRALLDPTRLNVLLHPKSKGSTREWPIEKFVALAERLSPEKFQVFVTGSAGETEACRPLTERGLPHVRDVTGRFSLPQFLAFIAAADALVAVGTGPVHLAAALGCQTVGLFPPLRPVHPGRWAPIGPNVQVVLGRETCAGCRPAEPSAPGGCACMEAITPAQVAVHLENGYAALISGGRR